MKKTITLLCILIFSNSCNTNSGFDSGKWKEGSEDFQPNVYRKEMLNDLLGNYKLTDVPDTVIIKLLGEPDYRENGEFGYEVMIDYGGLLDFNLSPDPMHIKSLIFYYAKDSIIDSCSVSDYYRREGFVRITYYKGNALTRKIKYTK
jgi:hypothetical protein